MNRFLVLICALFIFACSSENDTKSDTKEQETTTTEQSATETTSPETTTPETTSPETTTPETTSPATTTPEPATTTETAGTTPVASAPVDADMSSVVETAPPPEPVAQPVTTSPPKSSGIDWGDMFKQLAKEAIVDEVDKKAELYDMRIRERRGNSITVEVSYKHIYNPSGVEIEAFILSGGQTVSGFDSTYAEIDGRRGRARLRVTWANSDKVTTDQIKFVLSRQGKDMKKQAFELNKTWTASSATDVALAGGATRGLDGADMKAPEVILQELPKDAKKVALSLYWSEANKDSMLTASKEGKDEALKANYKFVGIQGYCFANEFAKDAKPLQQFYNASKKDYYTTASVADAAKAKAAGYAFVRNECYIVADARAGTTQLRSYFSTADNDYFTTAQDQGITAAKGAGYNFVRNEGYVYKQ